MTTTHTDVIPVTADDGTVLNLHHVTGERPATRGPVVLVHGAGVRANIFRPPGQTTLVDMLVDDGWDVWLENWRASIDLPPEPVDPRRSGGLRPPGPDPHRLGRDWDRLA